MIFAFVALPAAVAVAQAIAAAAGKGSEALQAVEELPEGKVFFGPACWGEEDFIRLAQDPGFLPGIERGKKLAGKK